MPESLLGQSDAAVLTQSIPHAGGSLVSGSRRRDRIDIPPAGRLYTLFTPARDGASRPWCWSRHRLRDSVFEMMTYSVSTKLI